MVNQVKDHKNKGEECSYELGRDCCKQSLSEESESSKFSDYWLNHGSLPLPELLLGREIFSSSCWSSHVVSYPVRDSKYISSCCAPQCVLSDTFMKALSSKFLILLNKISISIHINEDLFMSCLFCSIVLYVNLYSSTIFFDYCTFFHFVVVVVQVHLSPFLTLPPAPPIPASHIWTHSPWLCTCVLHICPLMLPHIIP